MKTSTAHSIEILTWNVRKIASTTISIVNTPHITSNYVLVQYKIYYLLSSLLLQYRCFFFMAIFLKFIQLNWNWSKIVGFMHETF